MANAGKVTLEVRTHASGMFFDPFKCPDCGTWWRGLEHVCPKTKVPYQCDNWHTCPMCKEAWSGLPHKCKRVISVPDGVKTDGWTYTRRPGGDEIAVTWRVLYGADKEQVNRFHKELMDSGR